MRILPEVTNRKSKSPPCTIHKKGLARVVFRRVGRDEDAIMRVSLRRVGWCLHRQESRIYVFKMLLTLVLYCTVRAVPKGEIGEAGEGADPPDPPSLIACSGRAVCVCLRRPLRRRELACLPVSDGPCGELRGTRASASWSCD